MSLIYLFAATRAEGRALPKPGTTGQNRVQAFITGVGPRAARHRSRGVLDPSGKAGFPMPGAVLVVGTCGGLSRDLPEGTIVIYSSCLSDDSTIAGRDNIRELDCSTELRNCIAQELAAQGIPSQSVVGITAPGVAVRRDEKLRLAARGARVVDMESYEILSAAVGKGIPSAVLRVVSDSLDRSLPDFTPAIRSSGAVDRLQAARIALAEPLSTLRLIFAQRRALRKLSPAIHALLTSDCFSVDL